MRTLEGQGVQCTVIAPALIPQRTGDRVKTDRRDADKLARLLRAGLLTAVHPPTPEQEAVRDLCRAREDLQADRKRNQQSLSKLLLRYGLASTGGTAWTLTHRRWLGTLRLEYASVQTAFDDYLRAVDLADERTAGPRRSDRLHCGDGALSRGGGAPALLPGH